MLVRTAAVLLGGLCASAIVSASPALADPIIIPVAGSESAGQTISDLHNLGFDVQINYENGAPNVPLSQCTVTDINTIGAAGSQPIATITINCPK
jgi:predicted ATP-dependent Lon-type protease